MHRLFDLEFSKKAVGRHKRPLAIKKGREGSQGRLVRATTSKKAVGCQKRPSAVKKGREGCQGRLVSMADIIKGLEDGGGLLQSHVGRSRHLVRAADIK